MTDRRPLVVIGDVLLDRDVSGRVERLSPDAPVPVVDEAAVASRPGGAGLAALLAAGDGRPVTLVTALADDDAADELRTMLAERGIEVADVGLDGSTPEKIRVTTGGRPLLRLDRGGDAGAVGEPSAAVRAAIGWAAAVLVADYGRGVAAQPRVREALDALPPEVPVVWDPHPRGPQPTAGAALCTPNLSEATALVPDPPGDAVPAVAARARSLAALWGARRVCVTCGARGAVLAGPSGAPLAVPAPAVAGGDPCGAGDRFASRAATALAAGARVEAAVEDAVREASRFVAAGGAGALGGADADPERPCGDDALAVAEAVRAGGGTVVATGGCFDLLHPGHITSLEAARALGDCLVVCLNSDASVRRLKGAGRPVVNESDRTAVLRALRCVDAVLVFDEDTPVRALERLRPDVWAKGGDYAGRELPEAAVLERWGGQAVVLPFVDGKSSTRLIEEASLRAVR
ncbi:MAG: D-beta-D-heptose 7-phosphate kinase / D-beta-D-heptose 1-phosphate adenosyltransferase [Solirubrobacteraceae bacterium]|nr:D-beta-D-heptose 7-phosphate kinase / D-beta-D-heptose 1-phosphate adenosyltransferase [Solirubrobacteraceae bacterium]